MAVRLVRITGEPEAFHDARDLAQHGESWLQDGAEAARREVAMMLRLQLQQSDEWAELAEHIDVTFDEDGDLAIEVHGPPAVAAQVTALEYGSPDAAPQPALRPAMLQGSLRGQWAFQKAVGV